jgi:hypothetical protein
MLVKGNDGGGDFEPIPAGYHNAHCIQIAGIGAQQSPWGVKHQVIITWELIDLKTDDGQPRIHSQFYTLALGGGDKPSNLRILLEGWRGKAFTKEEESGFKLENVLNKSCGLMFGPKSGDKKGTHVTSAARYAGEPYTPVNPVVFYDPDNHDEAAFQQIPEWIRERVNRPGAQADNLVTQAQETFQAQPAQPQPTQNSNPEPDYASSDLPF